MKNWFVALLALGAFAASSAHGSLILQINTTDQTYALSGSATGTGYDFYGNGTLYVARWYLAVPDVGVTFSESLSLVGLVSSAPSDMLDATLDVTLGFGASDAVWLYFSGGGSHTFTGTGAFVSYATLGAGAQAQFEGLVGQSMSLIGGSGFGDIEAVPEPTSLALLGLGAAVLGLRRRVRKA